MGEKGGKFWKKKLSEGILSKEGRENKSGPYFSRHSVNQGRQAPYNRHKILIPDRINPLPLCTAAWRGVQFLPPVSKQKPGNKHLQPPIASHSDGLGAIYANSVKLKLLSNINLWEVLMKEKRYENEVL